MDILISKLKKHNTYKDVKSIITSETPLYRIARNVNLDLIGYTLDDCLVDYKVQLLNKKEKRAIFEIWKQGESIYTYMKKHNLSSTLQSFLKHGINYNSNFRNYKYLAKLLKLDLPLNKFKIKIYDTHIELFGEKDNLIELRDKYKLEYDVIWEKEAKSYHLAFKGILYEYIKIEQKN